MKNTVIIMMVYFMFLGLTDNVRIAKSLCMIDSLSLKNKAGYPMGTAGTLMWPENKKLA